MAVIEKITAINNLFDDETESYIIASVIQDIQIFYNDYENAIKAEGFAPSEAMHESAGFLSTLRVLSEFWEAVFPEIQNTITYFGQPIDAALGHLAKLLDLTYNEQSTEFRMIEGGFLYKIDERAEKAISLVGKLETKIDDDIEPRLATLEEVLGDLDEGTIEALQYIIDNADEIRDLIEGNIEEIIDMVFN